MDDTNFCIWCGHKIGLDYDYCTYCGSKIDREEKKPKETQPITNYEKTLDEIVDKYEIKEKEARKIIEKRFSPPQMTYYKFSNELDDCRIVFYKKIDSTKQLVELYNEGILDNNSNVENKIKESIKKAELIISRINDLISEFIISDTDDGDDEELDNLFHDMDDLIGSVKNYN